MAVVEVRSAEQIDSLEASVRAAAARVPAMLAEQGEDGMSLLRNLKFGSIGFHAFEDRRLNLIEQANQTFATMVSLRAARLLLDWHPESDGFRLVLGPHPGTDIESLRPGLVAAEAFAAVSCSSNDKLKLDCARVAHTNAQFRYVFFHVPGVPEGRFTGRTLTKGVVAWSVTI